MPHVVVGIFSRDRGEEQEYFLVSSRKDYGVSFGAYYPPGGHMEAGENERSALARELKEELGIDITPKKKIAETPGDVDGYIVSWWSCESPIAIMKVAENELSRSGWFTQNEMKSIPLWPATQKFFEEHIWK